jgi:CHAT domain-containing protein/lipopolysaccharide biosynthesis regulator YciM
MIKKLIFRIWEKIKEQFKEQAVLRLAQKHSNSDEFINILKGLANVPSEKMGEYFFQIGSLLFNSSYYDHALASLEYASNIFKNENNSALESACYIKMGQVYNKIGKYDKGIEFAWKALGMNKQREYSVGEYGHHINLGQSYAELKEYYEQSLSDAKEFGDTDLEYECYYGLATLSEYNSEYDKAIGYYYNALDVAKQTGDARSAKRESNIYQGLGENYRKLGKYDKAIKFTKRSLEMRKKINDEEGQAACYGNLGIIYDNIGNQNKAIEYLHSALNIANGIEDIRMVSIASNAYNSLGVIYRKLGEYDKAIEFTERSLEMRKKINDEEGKSYNYNALGLIYADTGNQNKAIEYYEKSLSIAKETNNRTNEAYTYLNMGISYDKLNNQNKAIEYYEKSLSIAKEIEDTYTERLANVNLGIVYNESEPQKAFIYFKRAIEITEEAGRKISGEENKISFYALQAAFSAYQYMVPICVRLGYEEKAFEYAERSRSKAFFDLLARADLKHSTNETYFNIQNLYKIQKILGNKGNAVLVEYFITEDKIFTFVVSPKELHVKAIELSARKLNDFVMSYDREVIKYPSFGEIGDTWLELSNHLIDPISDHLSKADFVCFVPHNILHYIPLHALELHGKPIIRSHIVVYSPSASLLQFYENKGSGSLKSCLSFGIVFKEEAKAVADLFDKKYYPDITKNEILEKLKNTDADILHFSCHGYFNYANPMSSGIQLNNGVLMAQEIFNLRLKVELATLSACQTGINETKPGDELIGLTRALIYAGTPSVIVSLWSVDAKSTQELMVEFYKLLKEGKDKATALQQAQIKIMEKEEYSHPYYWAPFILVGDSE